MKLLQTIDAITEQSKGDRQEMREKLHWTFLKMKRILGQMYTSALAARGHKR